MSSEDETGFQFLAENSIDIICRAGLDTVLHYVSPSSFKVLGWRPEEMVGKRTDAFFLPADGAVLSGKSPAVVRMRMKDGTMAWVEVRHRVTRHDATGEPSQVILVIREITERKKLLERLSAVEYIDSRTGLSTAHGFDEAMKREWNRTQREGTCLSLLLLDFGHFRQFHDLGQHVDVDLCLANAAEAVAGILRITDFAARHGAEGIAILLPSTDPRGADMVAAKVLSAIEPLRFAGRETPNADRWPAVSIGISTVCARDGGTTSMPEILMLAAGNALRRSMSAEIDAHGLHTRLAISPPSARKPGPLIH